jgi:hypothetical protein
MGEREGRHPWISFNELLIALKARKNYPPTPHAH